MDIKRRQFCSPIKNGLKQKDRGDHFALSKLPVTCFSGLKDLTFKRFPELSQSQVYLVAEFGLYSNCFAHCASLGKVADVLSTIDSRCSSACFWWNAFGCQIKTEIQGGSERKMKQNSQLNLKSSNYMNINFIYGSRWKIKKWIINIDQNDSSMTTDMVLISVKYVKWCLRKVPLRRQTPNLHAAPPRIGVQLGSSVDPGNGKVNS